MISGETPAVVIFMALATLALVDADKQKYLNELRLVLLAVAGAS